MKMNRKQNQSDKKMRISVDDFIMPYFVIEGERKAEPVRSMPGVSRLTVDNLLRDIAGVRKLGVRTVLLFGVPLALQKNEEGSSSYAQENVVSKAVAAIKREIKDVTVITDVCLCAYTSHGHCGVLKKNSRGIDANPTLKGLSKMALVHAQAGADWVAPSAMAQRQVAAIRTTLDKHGYDQTKILGYSAKFASQFYGPFREAADSAPTFGDRRGYQLDYADAAAPLREIAADIAEGADMVMVKPALGYLDVIKEAKQKFPYPLAVYNVSGEYAFVKQGARAGVWDEKKIVFEILTSLKRAGADKIITYHAKNVAGWLADEKT